MARNSRLLAGLMSSLIAASMPSFAQTTDKPLVIALNHEPDTLDLTSSRDVPAVQPVMENVTESLWGVKTNGDMKSTLADWTVSPDGKVIEFKLHKGIKFQSGDPLTAADVVFSHQREVAKGAISYRLTLQGLDSVEAVDDMTVRFTYKKPNVLTLPSRALYIVSKAYFDRVGEQEFSHHPIGTGPYRVTGYKAGTGVDLEAWNGYWGAKPSIQTAHFAFVADDNARLNMLKAGEADIIMNLPYASVDTARKAGFKIASVPVHPTVSMQFHMSNPSTPWHDARVRLAIAVAIDDNAIVKSLLHDVPVRYAALAPNEIGYDPTLQPYPYDPTAAKKLLADAGYANGFKMPLYTWTGTYQGIKETVEAVALFLRAVGIDVQIQTVDGIQLLQTIRKVKTDPTAQFVAISPLPLANEANPLVGLGIGYSSRSPFSLYESPAFDAEIGSALQSLDPAEQGNHIRAAIKILHDDVGTIPFWASASVYGMKSTIDYTPTQKSFPLMLLSNVTRH